jgi:hypothetical protein
MNRNLPPYSYRLPALDGLNPGKHIMHAPIEVAGGPFLINTTVFDDTPQEELVVMVAHPEIIIARGEADILLQVDDMRGSRKSSALIRPVGALVLRRSEAGGGIYGLDPASVWISDNRAMAQFLDLIATFSKEAEEKAQKRSEAAEALKQLDNFRD